MNLNTIRLSDSTYKLIRSNFDTINLKSAIDLLKKAIALDINDNLRVINIFATGEDNNLNKICRHKVNIK